MMVHISCLCLLHMENLTEPFHPAVPNIFEITKENKIGCNLMYFSLNIIISGKKIEKPVHLIL